MWFAVKDENAHMLASDVYDAFLLVPLYMGMYYKEDIHIHGCVSKKLYKNVMNYLQRILCDFSDDLTRINVTVDGFAEAEGEPSIIGTGISCGVDSMTTIYDRYINESDPDYRINGLFLFNSGTHGDFGDKADDLYRARYEMNKSAAQELGLPVYLVNTNLHAFTHKIATDPQAGYLALWTCVLALQRAVKKYYISSAYSYSQILKYGWQRRNIDFSEFAESYAVPLVRTEKLELVSDGCQYERSMKTEHIADWDIARRYLNVCVPQAHNCSKCIKCLRTLIVLESLGKLEEFSGVFDIDTYRHGRVSFWNKVNIVLMNGKEGFMSDNYEFARAHGVKLPSYFAARACVFARRVYRGIRRRVARLLGR